MPQFNPYPILDPEQYRRPSYDELVNRPIQQGLDVLVQAQQLKRQQEKESLDQALALSNKSPYERQNYYDIIKTMQPTARRLNLFGRKQEPPAPLNMRMNEGRIPPPPPIYDDPQIRSYADTYGEDYAKKYIGAQDRSLKNQATSLGMEKTKLDIEKIKREFGEQQEAKETFSGSLQDLGGLFKKLYEKGAAVDTRKSAAENVVARARAGNLGQTVEEAFGTEAQSIRAQIKQYQPILLSAIRQATKQSGRGLDSDRELDFYLQSLADPKRDIQSQIQALQRLDSVYGLKLGLDLPDIGYGIKPGTVEDGYKYMMGDPSDPSNWIKVGQ